MDEDADLVTPLDNTTPVTNKSRSSLKENSQSVSGVESRSLRQKQAMQPQWSTLDKPSHIVGVGASAGGLNALQCLFDGIPPDTGAAYVVVQHLSPNFNTLMDELLSKHSDMTVKLADDGEEIKPNTVYVMRPNRNIIVTEGKLYLNEILRTDHPNLPIDIFFRSLAADAQNRSVGIILSGTGSDGSVGIKSLREAGGLVMAQLPDEAEFDGMPVSAVRTGYVDVVSELEKLPAQLVSYLLHPLTASKNSVLREHLADNKELLQQLFVRLKQATAVDFSLYKSATVARRIEHRMGINNIETLPAYMELLDHKPEEFALLRSDLLIGVTQFFRDKSVFEEIESSVVPAILKKRSADTPVRVWMVGVSSGEEAYSLAILFHEQASLLDNTVPVKIFASDADGNAIEYASGGVYPPMIANDISKERLDRYFTCDECGNYVITKSLRNMIVFANHNVLEDPPFSSMDLIVCRNMMIYLTSEAQDRTLGLFNFALREGGYLWLGSSESIGGQSENFRELSNTSKIWRKIRSSRIPINHLNQKYMRRAAEKSAARSGLISRSFRQTESSDRKSVYHAVRDRLLEEYCPRAILLDGEHRALHIVGDCSDILVSPGAGHVTTDVDGLLNPHLRVPVASCLTKVKQSEDGIYQLSQVKLDTDTKMEVTITGRKIDSLADSDQTYYVLLFDLQQASKNTVKPIIPGEQYQADSHTLDRMRELDLLLIDSRQELLNAYAELDTTSEELQATNEELMAANEELQSTNEELQSVNEELFTVNTEYQEKIAELMELNTDLDNLLKSTGYGIIFLDSTLSIRRFTPRMARFVNLLPGDIDRPIKDFKFHIDYPDMIDDMNRVLTTGEMSLWNGEFDNSGSAISITINPYISSDNSINGVVMTVRE